MNLNLGTQYYRPPFPREDRWADDLSRIRDAGLNTIQLWIVWAWVEAQEGQFRYEDYDRLIELANERGLRVVLSTIAEIHPPWIHRAVPGSEMIDHMGRQVVSSNRIECHYGLTPGGCTDHPGVWKHMARFLEETVKRYRGLDNLSGWDAWNELRWNVQADGLVCFCDETIARFRKWLEKRFGSLEGLNEAWLRRYSSWEDVLPGKLPNRTFTEMMAFQHFITWRANRHGIDRCQLIKSIDPQHVVTVHAAQPSPFMAGDCPDASVFAEAFNHAVNRGNDWAFADELEGIGTSSFPNWFGENDTDFQVRLNFIRSAARDKRMWLSELQGGASVTGNTARRPVPPRDQQRWLWQGIANGADTILFWCWRDEVFGIESGGFGITGGDGYARQRIEALRRTSEIIAKHDNLLSSFRPDRPEVGVLFSPQSYYLNWAQEGDAQRSVTSLSNYCRALSRLSMPCLVVEEEHLEELEGLRILFLPRVQVLDKATEQALEEFVRGGGVIVCESECGAFDSRGMWRYPEERLTARLTGVQELGRRQLTDKYLDVPAADTPVEIGIDQWLTPMSAEKGEVRVPHRDGLKKTSLYSRADVDQGAVFLFGTFPGNGVVPERRRAFDAVLKGILEETGVFPPARPLAPVDGEEAFQIYTGQSSGRRVVFLFSPESCAEADVELRKGLFKGRSARDLFSGDKLPVSKEGTSLVVPLSEENWGLAIVVEE